MTGFLLGEILNFNNYQYKAAEISANNATYTVRTDQSDNDENKFKKNEDKKSNYAAILMLIFLFCVIVLIARWVGSYDTWPPSNTSNEIKMEDVENIFPSGH